MGLSSLQLNVQTNASSCHHPRLKEINQKLVFFLLTPVIGISNFKESWNKRARNEPYIAFICCLDIVVVKWADVLITRH